MIRHLRTLSGTIAVLALLAVVGWYLYAPTMNAPFVFDDVAQILDNPFIRFSESSGGIGQLFKSPNPNRTLAYASFALDYYFHGTDVTGYHITNLIIHVLSAFLVFLIYRQTLSLIGVKDRFIGLLTAILWLVNPVHTQSVTYIVQRMNAMAAMFVLLSLVLYIKARRIGGARETTRCKPVLLMIGAGLAGLFGLASKENAAVLPVLILLYEWFFFQNLDRAWLKKQAGRIGLAAALLFIIIYVYLGGTPVEKLMGMYEKRSFTPGQRLLTEPRVVLYYLTLLAYPHPSRLNLDYNFPLSISLLHPAVTLPAILALLGLVAGAVYAARRHRLLAFAVLWFLVTLSIESSVVGLALIFEHRTYLPSIFLFIAATVLLNEYIRPKSLSLGILGILILLSAVWTYQRNCVWSDVLRLWQDGAAKSPQSPRILNNLGMAYKNINQIEKARQAFQAALAGDPEMISALNNLGMIMLQAGHPEAGLARFEKAIAIEPGYYDAHYNRGLALLEMGEINAAAAAFQEALRLNPFYVEAHNNLGVTLMRRLEIDSAITHFRRALKLNPAFLEAYNNMGLAYYKKGLADKAFEWFNRALDLDPFHVDAYNNMRRLRAKFNRYESPIKRLQNRLRREPDNPPLVFRLAEVYQQAGMLYPALQHYEKALALQPEAVDYLNQLGIFYAEHNQYRRAAEMFERLSDLLPNTPVFHYNLACLYARMGDKKKALHHLETAVKNGYDNLEQIISDKDLENLRDTEYLKTLTTIVKDREGG